MAITSNPYFDELSKQYGPFYATMKIAKLADAAYMSMPGRIEYSTAIDYVANKIPIRPEDFPDRRLDTAKEYLKYVDDIDVYDAVLVSYEESLDCSNLVYKYLNVKDSSRQARVRVLTNILWDRRPHKYD